MILEHLGHSPSLDPSAYVAPTATVCGDVTLGPGARIMHGACVVAEGGSIRIGANVIVLQNAVVRSTARWSTSVGAHTLIGPTAHVVGSTIEDNVFIATGAALFHGSRLGAGSEVRVHGVVHVLSRLAPEETVPIGWVAVGDPAQLFAPDRHEEIWAVQSELGFSQAAYGTEPASQDGHAQMIEVTRRLSGLYGDHADDHEVKD